MTPKEHSIQKTILYTLLCRYSGDTITKVGVGAGISTSGTLAPAGSFKGKTQISKKGNSHIRAALHMPSMTCVRCNPTLRQFHTRLKPKKAKPLVALIAVQRKLLVLMFTLWRNEEVYDAAFETKKQQKHEALAARDNKLIDQLVS